MAIYYLTISFSAGLGYVLTEHKKSRQTTAIYVAACLLLLIFVASCRYAIGFDYFSYRNMYEMVNGWSWGDILRIYSGEPLFFLFCKLIGSIGCPYQVFLMIINVFLLTAAIHFMCSYSKIPWLSIYFYTTLQFLAYNMNLIRQSLATAFFILAWPYLKNRKLLPYTILILIGGMFHNSLLFLYPLYFLLPLKQSKKSLLLLSALTTIIYVFFDPLFELLVPFLPTKYANYQGGFFWQANGFYYVLFPALYCLLIFLFRSRIENPLLRSVCLNSAIYHFVISLFITKHFILERFAVYPFVFSLIGIPEIIFSYRNQKGLSSKSVLTYHRVLFLFLIFGGAYFAFAAFCGFHHVYPYIGLWDKSMSSPN